MQSSRSFRIFIWLDKAKRKGELAPIYARVTINGKRAEISLQKTGIVYHLHREKMIIVKPPISQWLTIQYLKIKEGSNYPFLVVLIIRPI